MNNKDEIYRQAQKYDSFYLYDETEIIKRVNHLKNHFHNVKFLYSIKTNANQNVVHSILSKGFGVDAASVAEVMMGKSENVSKDDIQYSAPGKTKKNIEDTIHISTIIADSINEINLIDAVAQEQKVIAKIGVRLNPNFSFDHDEGISSKFGIDEDYFFEMLDDILKFQNIEIVGLHIHIRSQELKDEKLGKYYENVLNLANRVQSKLGYDLMFINMGSGIGIPYEVSDIEVNIQKLAEQTNQLIESLLQTLLHTQIYIETGRYVVGKSGIYVSKVLDKKISFGKKYVILHNTLNGFIRPSISQLVAKYSGDKKLASSEPLYTSKNPSQIITLHEERELEVVELVGNLCTATDVVATNIELPLLEIGDIVIFTNAGSYAAVLSPMQFSSQIPPKELFLTVDGNINI
ncbi:MAG: diaminopimelate decarboxylase [Eubacteriales bacterium]